MNSHTEPSRPESEWDEEAQRRFSENLKRLDEAGLKDVAACMFAKIAKQEGCATPGQLALLQAVDARTSAYKYAGYTN